LHEIVVLLHILSKIVLFYKWEWYIPLIAVFDLFR